MSKTKNKIKPTSILFTLALLALLIFLPIFVQTAHGNPYFEDLYCKEPLVYAAGSIKSGTHSNIHSDDNNFLVSSAAQSGSIKHTAEVYKVNKPYKTFYGTWVEGTITRTETSDDSYLKFQSETGTESFERPITNMNFTGGSTTGWNQQQGRSGTVTVSWIFLTGDAGRGNPSGSGGGSAYQGASENSNTANWGTLWMNFTYSFTTPVSGYDWNKASYAWNATVTGGGSNYLTPYLVLKATDGTQLGIDTGSTYNGNIALGYSYVRGISVSSLTAGTGYILAVCFKCVDTTNGDRPNVRVRVDDVGIIFHYTGAAVNRAEIGLNCTNSELSLIKNLGNSTKLVINVETQYTTSLTQTISVYNFASSAWEDLGSTSMGASQDEKATITLSTNVSEYIGSDGELRVKISGGNVGNPYNLWVDWVEWQIDYTKPNWTLQYRADYQRTATHPLAGINVTIDGFQNVSITNAYVQIYNYSQSTWNTIISSLQTETTKTKHSWIDTLNVADYIRTNGLWINLTVYGTLNDQWKGFERSDDYLVVRLAPLYQLNVQALDWSGNPVQGATVEVLGISSGATSNGGWKNFTGLAGGIYQIKIMWQGSTVNWTYNLAVSTDVTIKCKCRIYSVSLSFLDSRGSVIYPDQVTVLCPNGTTVTLSKFTDIHLQNGTFTYTKIIWQRLEVKPSTESFDPSTAAAPAASLPIQFSGQPAGGVYGLSTGAILVITNVLIVVVQFSSPILEKFRRLRK